MIKTIDNSTCQIDELNKKNNRVVDDYKIIFSLPCENYIKIIVTDDIYKERLYLSKTKSEKQSVSSSMNDYRSLNGLLVPPENFHDVYYAIINQNRYETNLYEKTLAHELTHAVDFFFYKEINPEIDLRVHDDILYYCSEIHAIYIGFKFYLRDIEKNFNIKSFAIETLNIALDEIQNAINTNNINKIKKNYAVFLGEYMAFKEKVNNKDLFSFKLLISNEAENILDKIINKIDFIKHISSIKFLNKNIEDFVKINVKYI